MGCTSSITKGTTLQIHKINLNHGLTDRQKIAVKYTWRILATHLMETGSKVFNKIFQMNPDIINVFSRNGDSEDLHLDAVLKGHIHRFMGGLGAVVENLDNVDDGLFPLLMELGEAHVKFAGYKPEYFDVFAHAMTIIWKEDLGTSYTKFVEESWCQLFNCIKYLMHKGYRKARVETNVRSNSLGVKQDLL